MSPVRVRSPTLVGQGLTTSQYLPPVGWQRIVAENCPRAGGNPHGGERTFRPGFSLEGLSMPHHPKPSFRSGRGWYVQLGKQQLKLCDGPQNSQTEAEAWQRYHAIMTERAAAPAIPPPAADSSGLAVAEVLDKYL